MSKLQPRKAESIQTSTTSLRWRDRMQSSRKPRQVEFSVAIFFKYWRKGNCTEINAWKDTAEAGESTTRKERRNNVNSQQAWNSWWSKNPEWKYLLIPETSSRVTKEIKCAFDQRLLSSHRNKFWKQASKRSNWHLLIYRRSGQSPRLLKQNPAQHKIHNGQYSVTVGAIIE